MLIKIRLNVRLSPCAILFCLKRLDLFLTITIISTEIVKMT